MKFSIETPEQLGDHHVDVVKRYVAAVARLDVTRAVVEPIQEEVLRAIQPHRAPRWVRGGSSTIEAWSELEYAQKNIAASCRAAVNTRLCLRHPGLLQGVPEQSEPIAWGEAQVLTLACDVVAAFSDICGWSNGQILAHGVGCHQRCVDLCVALVVSAGLVGNVAAVVRQECQW